jgi:hypothetical protein
MNGIRPCCCTCRRCSLEIAAMLLLRRKACLAVTSARIRQSTSSSIPRSISPPSTLTLSRRKAKARCQGSHETDLLPGARLGPTMCPSKSWFMMILTLRPSRTSQPSLANNERSLWKWRVQLGTSEDSDAILFTLSCRMAASAPRCATTCSASCCCRSSLLTA